MLELDFAVALALVLSVGSAVLCVAYGLARWNADDDREEGPPDPRGAAAGSGVSSRKGPGGA